MWESPYRRVIRVRVPVPLLRHAYCSITQISNLTYKHHTDKTHEREYSIEELQAKLEDAGFHVLVIRKEGPVSAAVLAEFVRLSLLRPLVRNIIKACQRVRLLHAPDLMADLYVVAEPKG